MGNYLKIKVNFQILVCSLNFFAQKVYIDVDCRTISTTSSTMPSKRVKISSKFDKQYNWVENPAPQFITIGILPQSQNIHRQDAKKKSVWERFSSNKSFLGLFNLLSHFFSILQMSFKEILIFYLLYVSFGALVYFGAWSVYSQAIIQSFANSIQDWAYKIPVGLYLGLVTVSFARASTIHNSLPNISDLLSTFSNSLVQLGIPNARTQMNKFSRYVLLMWIVDFIDVSPEVNRIFPDGLASLEDRGYLLKHEREEIELYKANGTHPALAVHGMLTKLVYETFRSVEPKPLQQINATLAEIEKLKKGLGGILKEIGNKLGPLCGIMSTAAYCFTHAFGLFVILGHVFQPSSETIMKGLNLTLNETIMASVNDYNLKWTMFAPNGYAVLYVGYIIILKLAEVVSEIFNEKISDLSDRLLEKIRDTNRARLLCKDTMKIFRPDVQD